MTRDNEFIENLIHATPDVIYIYRLPHLEMQLSPADLRDEIATTIVHEIAHYFGIDDEKLHELGWG